MQCLYRDTRTGVYLDFAHAPSKVRATVEGMREAFPDRPLVAVLELHTFSSLREDFVGYYRGTLDEADTAIVFADNRTFEHKGLPQLRPDQIRQAFGRSDLQVVDDPGKLEKVVGALDLTGRILLFMSSGAFGGFDPHSVLGGLGDTSQLSTRNH